MNNTMIQKKIDSIEYPPNHKYLFEGLKPLGGLAKRFTYLSKVAPNFFTEGKRFLDVGCNKSFFSLYAGQYFEEVVGIDLSRDAYVDLWKSIEKPNIQFIPESFRDFTPQCKRFDKIWFGNVHYKLWSPSKSWDWVYKLATISSGQVLIEGPLGATKFLLKNNKKYAHPSFSFQEFMKPIEKFFTVKFKIPDPCIPERYIMLLERRPSLFDNPIQLSSLPKLKMLKKPCPKGNYVFQTSKGLICKVSPKRYPLRELSIDLARLSPESNGIEGVVYDEDKFVGWLEKQVNCSKHRMSTIKEEILFFKSKCRHQIFLSRNGYIDADPAIINFTMDKGRIICFDKDALKPVRRLRPGNAVRWYKTHVYPAYFPKINKRYPDIWPILKAGIDSRDSVKVEAAFKTVQEKSWPTFN